MEINKSILEERKKAYNKIKGARVGDYLLYKKHYVRFSHNHGDSLQTSKSGSFYFGNGYISFSGGLEHGIGRNQLIQTDKTKMGEVWFFDRDISGASRGKYYNIPFRVFVAKDENSLRDYDILGFDIEEERLKNTKEKITLVNGNKQQYRKCIPQIIIRSENIYDICLEHIRENTGLVFEKFGNSYKAQPQTSKQVLSLLMTYNFKTQYHDGIYYHNTLLLKFCDDTDFKV